MTGPINRLRRAAASLTPATVAGAVRTIRFSLRVRRSSYYPVVFNEPLNWVPEPGTGPGSTFLRWVVPSVAWHAGPPAPEPGGMRLIMSERIAELPFAHRALVAAGVNPPAQVLEFGSVHSRLALELASLGYHVVAVDLNPYPFAHPNLTFVQGNLLTLALEVESMDAAVAISVIEHAGLEVEAGYGEPVEGEDDITIMRRLYDLLRPGGLLAVTVPFGHGGIGRGYRVYEATSLARLIAGWTVQEAVYMRRESGDQWTPCAAHDLAEVDSIDPGGELAFPVQGVALLALRKPTA